MPRSTRFLLVDYKDAMPNSSCDGSSYSGDNALGIRTRIVERRRTSRGGNDGEPSRKQIVTLVLGTYREMPGLSLYLHQAARLFGLRDDTCRAVLSDLVKEGRLRQSADGQYRV
jgi:hypothetical protein